MLPFFADAGDLAQWANRLDAPGYLPKLIRRLILATTSDIKKIEMRSGEGTRYSGYDGILEVGSSNAFVSTGLSVWEMGVDQEPKGKANDDYNKRSTNPLGLDPSQVTFVFVTPRRWAGKEDWAHEKRNTGLWRDVRVMDADNLETWLELAPVVHAWVSHIIGKDPGELQALETFWENWQEVTQPPLSAELVIFGRGDCTERISQHLQAQPSALTVRADSQEEALAFIAATFDKLPDLERSQMFSRTIIVESIHAWRQITFTERRIVLLPTFKPVDVVQATRNGHHVLIPAGRETVESHNMAVLQRPPRQAVIAALQSMGFTQERASSLASIARRSLLSLRRTLSINPEVQQPVWANPGTARAVFPALLAGGWDDAIGGDQRIIEALAGRPYEGVTTDLVLYTNQSDPPVQQIGTTWSIASKEDAWQLLARYLTRQDLDRFCKVTVDVLGTLDPALELPTEKQWMANTLGHARPHSQLLREGLADTLALIATRASDTLLGSTMTGQNYATFVVRQLFEKANEDQSGQVWISLSDVLPLLAEASPDSFLDAIDNASLGPSPVILKLWTGTSGDPFTKRSAHPNLLWALERLAWSPAYLSSAALCLARLVRLVPDDRLVNHQPGQSLRAVFCPWWPQTAASFDERLRVLDMLRQRESEISWKLILSLLPTPHETADPTDSPCRRDWKPEEQKGTFSLAERWSATEVFVKRLVADVSMSSSRICDLVKHVGNLPPPSRIIVFEYLESLDSSGFDIDDRKTIQDELRELISSHRRFTQASWAMPIEDVERLVVIYERFNSENLIEQVSWLFTAWPQLPDVPKDDPEKRETAVYHARVMAAQQVYESEGLQGLFALMEVIERPDVLGWVLGKSDFVEKDDEDSLLGGLGSSHTKHHQVAAAYVGGCFLERGWEWVDKKLDTSSSLVASSQRALFFLHLPPGIEVWKRLEQYDNDVIDLYWEQFLPYVADPVDCFRAVEQLLARGRAWEALDLIEPYLETIAPPGELIMGMLELAIRTPLRGPVGQSLVQLFNYLERTEGVDEERLARIEWAFLPLFRYEKRSFKILHNQLAVDPAFFVEVISAAYRATGEEPSELDKREQFLATAAYYLLQSARVVPGTQEDDTIDAEKLFMWVREARRLLSDCKRLKIGNQCIGRILRCAKLDEDQLWPAKVIRDLVETLGSNDVELGMEIGIRNDRGVIWRNPMDGGQQERQIAERYNAQAQLVQEQWPRTARMLRRIAQAYEDEAQRNDRDAERRQEGW